MCRRRYLSWIVVVVAAMAMPAVAVADADALERYLMAEADTATALDIINVYESFDSRQPSAVEGVWRISGTEGTMAVVADEGTIFYRIIAVDSEDLSVVPGSIMGACTPAGRSTTFDARIFTSVEDGRLCNPRRFTLTLADDGRLVIIPVNNKLRVNLWRMIPYMFRASVSRVNDRPNNIDGAIRIYPVPSESPLSPRCL